MARNTTTTINPQPIDTFNDIFVGAGIPLPINAYETAAKELGVEPEILQAIAIKESGYMGSYLADGRLMILYEAHIFARYTKNKYNAKYPNISSKTWNRNLYGAGGANQYRRLEKAMALDRKAALLSCSYGMFQIMGFEYEECNYPNVESMIKAFAESELNQLKALCAILKYKGLVPALRAKDFNEIAYKYNGPGYKKNNYHTELARIYKELTSNVLREGSRGTKVINLQLLLQKHGYYKGKKIDGHFGPLTKIAVEEFQTAKGLTVDGIVGPQTYEALATERIKDETKPILTSKRTQGSAVLGSGGAGTIIDGLNTLAEANQKITEVATSPAGGLAIEMIRKNQEKAYFQIGLGILMIVLAGYFVWTKWYDRRKQGGVK